MNLWDLASVSEEKKSFVMSFCCWGSGSEFEDALKLCRIMGVFVSQAVKEIEIAKGSN